MRGHGLLYTEELRLRDEGGTQYLGGFPAYSPESAGRT